MTARIKVKWLSIQRKTIDPLDMPDGDLELWSIPDFDNGSPSITNRQSIGSSKKVVFPGDVLLSKIVPHIRRAWIVRESNLPQYASTEWLTFHSSKVRPEFLRYALLTDEFNRQMQLNSNGMGSLKRADPEKVGEQQINLPTIRKQKIIADFLDKRLVAIDAVLHQKSEQLKKLSSYRQSLITRAVTKGLDPNVEMQDRELEFIGKYPKHWKATTVGRIYLMSNGLSQSGEFFGHGFPFFSYGDVYKNYALPETPSGLVQSDEKERANCSILRGDVFFTRTSETVEELGMASTSLKNYENATFAGFLIRARPKINLIEPEFAKFYFRAACHRAFFEKNTNLVTRASLSQTLLTRLPVLIPPKEEQIKIYEYCQKQINSLDNLSLALQKQIKKMKEYRSSLISAAVTGQLAIDEEASA